jgi:hypothetical protein
MKTSSKQSFLLINSFISEHLISFPAVALRPRPQATRHLPPPPRHPPPLHLHRPRRHRYLPAADRQPMQTSSGRIRGNCKNLGKKNSKNQKSQFHSRRSTIYENMFLLTCRRIPPLLPPPETRRSDRQTQALQFQTGYRSPSPRPRWFRRIHRARLRE